MCLVVIPNQSSAKKLWNKEIRILKHREEFQVSSDVPQEFILIFKCKFLFV